MYTAIEIREVTTRQAKRFERSRTVRIILLGEDRYLDYVSFGETIRRGTVVDDPETDDVEESPKGMLGVDA